ncbi:hypothetical protein [Arthrobacter sp.]|uniref:hypothetical protein n=1 Tax=Arthrobacter sp. TaxID=1667 RepID=UPI0028126812|nr:hypothetical protein [Arthrobacter sp.]
MDHKLRILVRLDIDRNSAVLAVTGCLTTESYRALLPVIRRANALVDGVAVIVDLRNAIHVDAAAAEALNDSIRLEHHHHELGAVTLQLPDMYPACGLLASLPPVPRLIAAS